ncbi:MAG: DUF2264 domain-containing protein [Lachnospiraceae bacterium]|jgi:hypothetical protein|nr:DUF2264 domain-containing protein [Lachnospiraceae bacterium]
METVLKNRRDAVELFLRTIRPLKPFYSEHHAFLHVGNTGVHYGEKSARMEGFARIMWGLGPLWSADNTGLPGELQTEIAEWLGLYKDGLVHGTTPEDEEYWADIFDCDQKMVEVAAIVFSIAINQKALWEDFSDTERENLYRWLNQINDNDMPKNNWRYFRILTNMTFRLLGLAWNEERMKEDFGLIESFYIGDGWYFDGQPTQIDYYVAFAIHYYGLIYAKLMEEVDPEKSRVLKERSKLFFPDFVYWFANNGEEIPFGRSLTYRYAHSSTFAAMAYAELDVDYGVLKNLVLRNLESWMKRPIFDNAGVLTIGYGYPNIFMSENYNGCGSPYWCNKVFLILGLNEDHRFWTAEEKEYPYEKRKLLKQARMLITHDENHHVLAYVTGQHCGAELGQDLPKYEKFVYSNQFGISVPRGTTLQQGAFDDVLVFSREGENRYCMRNGFTDYDIDEKCLSVSYSPMKGVKVKSRIVPYMNWHVRIHQIETEEAIDIADGGFALPQERCYRLTPGRETGRFKAEDVHRKEHMLTADFPWGSSAIVSETGQDTELIVPFSNTNLFYNLTVIPTVQACLKPGKHLIVTSAAADFHQTGEELLTGKPTVKITEHEVVVAGEGEEIRIDLDK